jgi:predicted alpha/beta superfamily hydrolase
MIRPTLASIALLVAGCGGGGGDDGSPPPNPAGAAKTETLSISSSYTGVTYPLTVYLPAGYATSTGPKRVLYAMDHDLQFAVVRQFAEMKGLDAIIVSIGAISSDRRFIDFDLPGAAAYYKFLTLELIPRVEAQYRIDPAKRSLLGYSLSGLMGVIAIFQDHPTGRYFKGYVMTDPSMQFHTAELLAAEQQLWDATHSLPITAYHCQTATGTPWDTLAHQMQARGYQGLDYKFQPYPLTHQTVLAPCIADGLDYLFARG